MKAVAVGLLLLTVYAGQADAATDKWVKEISRLEEHLAKKDWKGALDRAVEVRQKMVERIDEAEDLIKPLAQALALQALAEANLGRDDDALWHWQAAQGWLEGLEKKDLAPYGRAREVLANPPSPAVAPVTAGKGSYQPVRIRQAAHPVYPGSLRKTGKEGKVRVRLIVGPDGRPSRPAVLAAGIVPSMAFPVLDALRQWRFDPATDSKRPLAVEYEIEVRYP